MIDSDQIICMSGDRRDDWIKAHAPSEGFPMSNLQANDWRAIAQAVNIGIDSHLEGLTRSQFHLDARECRIDPAELHVLVRRLLDGDDAAYDLASCIVEVLCNQKD